jgi:hydrogenase expression/formation protein HypC
MCLAIPGRITEIQDNDPVTRMGRVDFGGVFKEVNLSFVPDARPGDYVIVHAGFALNTIDEAEAGKILEVLDEIDELGGLEDTGS